MGVLNFESPLHRQGAVQFDVLSIDANLGVDHRTSDPSESARAERSARNKRKRIKPGENSTYYFRDYGVDERRRGAKHQRRKQNFSDLLALASDNACEDCLSVDEQMTVFAELFLDDQKMKVWEHFIGLSEDKQVIYLEEYTSEKSSRKTFTNKCEASVGDDENVELNELDKNYMLIDKKIRDMLRSKQLANNGLLKYYEDEVLFCNDEVCSPSLLVFNLESAYDRMLVYAVCQFMKLSANTIKLKPSTLIEIELDQETSARPCITLTKYLTKKGINSV